MYDLNTRFFSAMRRRRASASPSVLGEPMSMAPPRRIACGTTESMRSARVAKPSAAIIAACSAGSGPMWRRSKAPWSSRASRGAREARETGVSGMAIPLGSGFLVCGGVEELVHVRGIGWLDAVDPGAIGVLVHLLRLARQIRVGPHDLAGNRRVDVGRGLHRLDDADRLARVHLAPG